MYGKKQLVEYCQFSIFPIRLRTTNTSIIVLLVIMCNFIAQCFSTSTCLPILLVRITDVYHNVNTLF